VVYILIIVLMKEETKNNLVEAGIPREDSRQLIGKEVEEIVETGIPRAGLKAEDKQGNTMKQRTIDCDL